MEPQDPAGGGDPENHGLFDGHTDVEPGVPASDSAKSVTSKNAGEGGKNGGKGGGGRLSIASKSYDFDRTGELDDVQRALRDRDESGRGYLRNEELYELMQDHQAAGTKIVKYRTMIMVLVAFAVLLAISNLGTSIAAATLAKDTTTQGNDLVDKRSQEVVAVQSVSQQYTLTTSDAAEGDTGDASNRRAKACSSGRGGRGGTKCYSTSFSVSSAAGQGMIDKCESGRRVSLVRTFSKRRRRQLPICPVETGYSATYTNDDDDRPSMILESSKGGITIRPDASGGYVIEGDGITSDEGQPCDGDSDCDDGLACQSKEKTCIKGEGSTYLDRSDLQKFADTIVKEAATCLGCEAEKVIKHAIESYGQAGDEEAASQLLGALYDNSTNIFDDAKIALLERDGKHAACDAAPAPGASGLCKGEAKKAETDSIKSQILGGIGDAEAMEETPDMDAIATNVEMRLSKDDLLVDWLLKDDSTAVEEIKERRDSATSKVVRARVRKNAIEVNTTLNKIMDNEKDLNQAVRDSGFTDGAIEEAFRYFKDVRPETVEELGNRGGRAKMQSAWERVDAAYAKRGWSKQEGRERWTPPGGGDGSRWAKGQSLRPSGGRPSGGRPSGGRPDGAAVSEDDSAEAGEFYVDEQGDLRFEPPPGNSTAKSFEEQLKEIEEEERKAGDFRKLMDNYIQDSHDLKRRLEEGAGAMHRHLSGVSSLCSDKPQPLGCFQDQGFKRDLPYSHGSVDSVQACLNACNNVGFIYAGLQAGSACYCGNSFGSHGESTGCSTSCSSGGTCGGVLANTIYKYIAYEKIDCVASGFEDHAANLLAVTSTVSSSVTPVTALLDTVANGVELLKTANNIGLAIQIALTAAGFIPYIGGVFSTAKSVVVDPIMRVLKIVVDKAKLFQNTVGTIWQKSFGKLADVVDNMETSFVGPIMAVANGLHGVGSNQCSVSIVTELASFDVVGTVDQALGHVVGYVENLLKALTDIGNALASSAWQTIQSTLQKVVDVVSPLFDFLEPLQPLADLLKREITLPWFQPPYLEKYLGEAYCHNNYKRGAWPNTCWEKEDYYWEEISLIAPWYLGRTCKSGGYTSRLLGGCYNEYYTAQTRGFSWGWSGPYCASGYGVYWWRPYGCTRHCPWDRHMDLGYCYKKTCKSGFNADYIRCNPHTRPQASHTALCDRYSYDSDANRYLASGIWAGECWQGCSSGDSSLLGLCFPPAELKISIAGIFDAFQSIIDFIMDLPIVSLIFDAIDAIVGVILKPVTDALKSMTGFEIPEFPSISLGDLPLDFFKDFSFNLPSLPDLSQVFNIPEEIVGSLPGVPSAILDCGIDANCLDKKLGVSNIIDDAVGDVGEFFDAFEFDKLKTIMYDLLGNLGCAEWQDVQLPVEDFLTAIPGISNLDNACDFDIPVCTSFDTAGVQETIDNVFKPFFQSVANRKLSTARSLNVAKSLFTKLAGSIALLNLEIPVSLAVSFGRQGSDAPLKKRVKYSGGIKLMQVFKQEGENNLGKDDEVEYPAATAITFTPSVKFSVSPTVDFCRGKFYVSFTPSFGFSVASNTGNERLFRDALETAKNYHEGGLLSNYANDIDISSDCANSKTLNLSPIWKYQDQEEANLLTDICTLKVGALSVANLDWVIPKRNLPRDMVITFEAKGLEEERLFGMNGVDKKITSNPIPSQCTIDAMETKLAETTFDWASEGGWKHAWPCIQYWFDQKTLLDGFKTQIDELSVARGARLASQIGTDIWEQVSTVTFPTSLLQATVAAAYENIAGSDLIPPSNASSWMGGTLSTSIGLAATHPYYTGTSIGLNLGFHGALFGGIKSFNVGSFELSHMKDLLLNYGDSKTRDSLKNGILKTWTWGASLGLSWTKKVELFDWEGWGC